MTQKKLPLINSAHGSETRNIINELIKLFNGMGYTYNEALQKAHNVLKEAQQTNDMNESVQQQINTLIAESGTSDAEVLQARIDADGNEYTVLKERLDESDAQLAQKAERNYVDDQLSNISSGSPSGAFPTLEALELEYPNGNEGKIYVVSDNNMWYYFDGTWKEGGLYNATVSSDFPAKNELPESSFSDGRGQWAVQQAASETIVVSENTISFKVAEDRTSPAIARTSTMSYSEGDVLYAKTHVKADTSVDIRGRINFQTSITNQNPVTSLIGNAWQQMSITKEVTGSGNVVTYFYIDFLQVAPNYTDDVIHFKYPIMINLTKTFGKGNEPTVEEMDRYMNNYPYSWFDETVSPFLTYKNITASQQQTNRKIETIETDVSDLFSLLSSGGYKKKIPNPSRITPTLKPINNTVRFKFMEPDGTLWGTESNRVIKSVDDGDTWQTVLTIDQSTYGEIYATGLFVTDKDIILIGTMTGNVLKSNKDQTSYDVAFQFNEGGQLATLLGYKMYENLVFIGGYNSQSGGVGNSSNEVYMSKDFGATWDLILTAPIRDATGNNAHIHDVEYDPWDKRIFVSMGDSINRNFFYSDDMGLSWVTLFDAHDEEHNLQPTQIIAYAHGIIMGSDSAKYGGLHYLPRKDGFQAPINKADIIPDFYPIPNGDNNDPTFFAVRSYFSRNIVNPISIMSFRVMHPEGNAYLLASINGYDWYEIWKSEDEGHGVAHLFGNVDGTKATSVITIDGTPNLFKFDIPKFVELN